MDVVFPPSLAPAHVSSYSSLTYSDSFPQLYFHSAADNVCAIALRNSPLLPQAVPCHGGQHVAQSPPPLPSTPVVLLAVP